MPIHYLENFRNLNVPLLSSSSLSFDFHTIHPDEKSEEHIASAAGKPSRKKLPSYFIFLQNFLVIWFNP